MKLYSLTGAWLIGALIIVSASYAATPEEEDAAARAKIVANLGKAKISLSQAVQAALARFPGGHAVEALFEVDGDQPEFYVEVIASGKHHDVSIDAKDGKVIAVEDTEDERAEEKKLEETAAKAKVNLRQAIEIALKQVPKGKAYEAYPEMDGQTLVYLVALLTSDKIVAVEIDAASGKVLGTDQLSIPAK